MRIGVLALQGDFTEHARKFRALGHEVFEIRQLSDLNGTIDGLALPGGESTVMGKLLRELELLEPLRTKINNGLPVFATCAGMILLADSLEGYDIKHLGTMSIRVKRNAYGRQLGSFRTISHFEPIGDIPMTFIRAPYIEKKGNSEILAEVDGKAVAAREGNQIALAFHPELDDDNRIFEYFIGICSEYKNKCCQ